MPQFRKKATTVDAVQVPLPAEKPGWVRHAIDDSLLWELTDKSVRLRNAGVAHAGDWIVHDDGLRICRGAEFATSYDPA
jgi:hypothetical protein